MKRILAMLALAIVVGLVVSSCTDDNFDELKIESPQSEEFDGTGNEGGNGGHNPPPGGG